MKNKKRYKDMTTEEKIEHDNRVADRNTKIALWITIVTILLWIIAYLDKIVFFVRYALSCLHYPKV